MSQAPVTVTSELRLRELPSNLNRQAEFVDAVESLRAGGRATFDGVWGASSALLAAALSEQGDGPLLLVTAKSTDADLLADDLQLFTGKTPLRFPAWETEPNERVIQDEHFGERLRTLKYLLQGAASTPKDTSGTVIVTSIQSLLQPTPSLELVERSSRILRNGSQLDIDAFRRWLVDQRFHSTSAVELPGEFSVRGGIVDLFAPDWQWPVRIELFDNEIESIRRFDISSQRSLETLAEVEITIIQPTSHSTAHFADYLPATTWCLLIEPEQIDEQGRHYLTRIEHPADFHSVESVLSSFKPFASATASSLAPGATGVRCALPIESVERFSGDVKRVREELERSAASCHTFVVTPTEAEIERLHELFGETVVAKEQRLHFAVGQLSTGFRLLSEAVLLISATELFQRGEVRRVARRRLGKAIDSFHDLRAGDLVVHLSHGIGRYRGIELLDKQGQLEEHLQIEFRDRAKLYVPAAKIDLIQKYIGGTKTRPTLAKLGGATWLKQKQAAESAVMDMAVEMIELQAARQSRPGIAFAPDGEWQREFDSSFPYEETRDQLLAIDDIKGDMEASRPMDRLLCGDVGFGKTEMAMRAAFKAVDNGYQVAVLVPTTILAEQHYHTFSERMAEFPFDIGRLSRFCTTQEERQVVEGLKSGRIDIVIGTHRLASKDVTFHNLGLVIIDEEQRFGVEVKERLKSLRSTVDVLTMTATPIPRTLHMSLVGVRDISNLESPPEDRVAVETRVTRFSNELIRHAVLRELSRGGQIYFVHNRVQDIEVVAKKLRSIVPEASIRIGHGQMHEDELEQVMVDFVAGRFDLLLATTIVESGLDIPAANTIFIDEADRYGLADLHQLRGRVGRYKHRAYCYLLIDPHKHVTPNAAKRLRAIEEYSEMGAGFALAMRDLEIRGTGNLLGMQQSGHIAAVGYEFYCELLEGAVRSLKQLPRKLSVDVDVELPTAAYIPDDYVPDIRLKIDLYRRLRRAATYDDLSEFRAELIDRFGAPPDPVERMLELSELRLDATIWQIVSIAVEGQYLVFGYADRKRMEQLVRSFPGPLRIADHKSAYLKVPEAANDPSLFLETAKSVLRSM
ncbi:MAG: transcription-repair coupling factor [Planctomycetaceae bacterium]|nr:transcription-repair coupling factor [Planctomycetales bacterium]MCB9925250.1 transcription-repair coupling factor [Planctomycetaceae bacterium]